MTVDNELIGSRIQILRQWRQLEVDELAGLEISASYVSSVERGQQYPSLDAVKQFAEILKCPISYLTDGVAGRTAELQAYVAGPARLLGIGAYRPAAIQYRQMIHDPAIALLPDLYNNVLLGYAHAVEQLGQPPAAIDQLESLRTRLDPAHALFAEAHAALSRCYRRSRLTHESERTLNTALELIPQSPGATSDSYVMIAAELMAVYDAQHDHEGARRVLADLNHHLPHTKSPRARFIGLWRSARTHLAHQQTPHAIALAQQASELANAASIVHPLSLANSHAELLLDTHNQAAAAKAVHLTESMLPHTRHDPDLSLAQQCLLVRAHTGAADFSAARTASGEIMIQLRDTSPAMQFHGLKTISDYHMAAGDQEGSVVFHQSADGILHYSGIPHPGPLTWEPVPNTTLFDSAQHLHKPRKNHVHTGMAQEAIAYATPAATQEPPSNHRLTGPHKT